MELVTLEFRLPFPFTQLFSGSLFLFPLLFLGGFPTKMAQATKNNWFQVFSRVTEQLKFGEDSDGLGEPLPRDFRAGRLVPGAWASFLLLPSISIPGILKHVGLMAKSGFLEDCLFAFSQLGPFSWFSPGILLENLRKPQRNGSGVRNERWTRKEWTRNRA